MLFLFIVCADLNFESYQF